MALLLGNDVRRLASGISVNPFAATAYPVYTAPSSNAVVLTQLVLRCSAANSVTIPASAKVEITGAGGDIFSEEVLIGVVAVGDTWAYVAEARGLVVLAGTQVDVVITNPATGTSQTLLADVFGYVIY